MITRLYPVSPSVISAMSEKAAGAPAQTLSGPAGAGSQAGAGAAAAAPAAPAARKFRARVILPLSLKAVVLLLQAPQSNIIAPLAS